jgi:hypothetical protein
MSRGHSWSAGPFVIVSLAIALAIIAVCGQTPMVAWNSGTRERLTNALDRLKADLMAGEISPHALLPRISSDSEDCQQSDFDVKSRYGVRTSWRTGAGSYSLVFIPLAVSENVILGGAEYTEPHPQVIMVPLNASDRVTFPVLAGCEGLERERLWQCQIRTITARLREWDIVYAAALMSDGSIMYVNWKKTKRTGIIVDDRPRRQ